MAIDSRVERTASRMLLGYMRFAARRGRLRWCDVAGRVLDPAAVADSIDRLRGSIEPLIVTYWISDALAVASLPLMDAAFARLFATLTCVVDETFTGRVAGRYIEAIGGQSALVAMPSDPERLRQLLVLIRRRASCAFPVDGSGPYHRVGTGIVSLATTLGAPIVPLAAVARPALPAIHASNVRLPSPAPAIFASLGQPLYAGDDDRRAQAQRLATELDAMAAAVRRAAAEGDRRPTAHSRA